MPPWHSDRRLHPGTFRNPTSEGAVPIDQRNWFAVDDYPSDAMMKDAQGMVTVSFVIDAKGRVGECQVVKSSGSAILDRVPCPVMQRRARFEPAIGPNGSAIPTKGTKSTSFWLP